VKRKRRTRIEGAMGKNAVGKHGDRGGSLDPKRCQELGELWNGGKGIPKKLILEELYPRTEKKLKPKKVADSVENPSDLGIVGLGVEKICRRKKQQNQRMV